MHSRRLACFVLGVWLAGGVFMAWVATENFRSVDRLLDHSHPAASLEFRSLGPQASRLLLRYAASEQNRYFFENWEVAQIILGILFFLFLLFGTHEDKFSLIMALVLLIITVGQRLAVTPELVALGRSLDFLPPDTAAAERTKFMLLHRGYEAIEAVKWVVVLILAGRLFITRRRKASPSELKQLDMIKKTNYRPADH